MKKLLAVFCALMLFAVPALAEPYTHPTLGFSLECPEGWLAVDNANIDAYIAAYEKGEMDFTGTNQEVLKSIKPQMDVQESVILVDPLANNISIACADIGMECTAEIFRQAMSARLMGNLKAQIPTITFMDEGSVVEMNGREFMTLMGTYENNGLTVGIQQIYYLEGTFAYVFNITVTSLGGAEYLSNFDLIIDQIVSSFNTNK